MLPVENLKMIEADVRTLDCIRTTAWQGIEECPHRWAFNRFVIGDRVDEEPNIYAKVGTAVHATVERFLRGQCEFAGETWFAEREWLRSEGVTEEEVAKVNNYLVSLHDYRPLVRQIESEFLYLMPGVDMPIKGHRDAVYELHDGSILVQDHKTNRRYNDRDWWRTKFQPRIYSWATRHEYPGRTIHYEIGYVNLETKLRWETSPQDDWQLMEDLQRIWQALLSYSESSVWPQKVNDNCGFCPIRDQCDTFQSAARSFMESIQTLIDHKGPEEIYMMAVRMKKIAEDMIKETEPKLRAIVATGTLHTPLGTFEVEYSERRQAEFTPIWNSLAHRMMEDPDLRGKIYELAPEMFTVKVTGLDKLLKMYPDLKPDVEPHVKKVRSSEGTLKVRTHLARKK